jgi:hypothetical protein
MHEHPEEPEPEERDERAATPPEDDGGEDAEGPRGNPEVDEEALRHGQQDREQ